MKPIPPTKPSLRSLLAAAYLLFVTLLSYGSAFAPSNTFLPADLLLLRAPYKQHAAELEPRFTQVARPATDPLFQFYPSRKFLRDSLREGTLPLWNPLSMSGTPFAADDQSAIFYPLNWLFVVLPLASAFGLLAALHTFLTGLFFWMWGRRLGWGDVAALGGATVWMLSGVLVAWQMWQVVDDTLCWLPLALYFWEGYRASCPRSALVGMAAALGLSLLAGHMQFAFYVWLTVLCYVLYRPAAPGLGGFGIAMLPFGIGSALGFVQVTATADMLLRSLRAHVTYDAMLKTAMPFKQLGLLVMPNLLGGQRDDALSVAFGPVHYVFGETSFAHAPFVGDVNLYELTCYCGITSLVFAGIALCALRVRRDLSRLWLGLGCFAVLMGCGSPVFGVFYHAIPIFKSFHGVARILVLFDFCVAALCSAGIQRACELDPSARRKIAARVGVALVLICALFFRMATTLQTSVGDAGYLLSHDWMANGHVARTVLVPMLLMACAAVCAAYAPPGAMLAVVALDMLLFGVGFNTGTPARCLFPQTAETRYVSEHLRPGERVLCLADARDDYQSRLMPNSAMALGWPDVSGNDPLVLASYDRLMRAVNKSQCGTDYPAGLGLITSIGSPVLDVLGLKYVIAPSDRVPPVVERTPGLRLVVSGDINVYVNDRARGLAWLDGQPALSSDIEGTSHAGTITVYVPDGGRMGMKYTLVTNTVWEPGWGAIVDGRKWDSLDRNNLLAVSPIGSKVTFRYLPAPIQSGLYVSLLGICVLIGLLSADLIILRAAPPRNPT